MQYDERLRGADGGGLGQRVPRAIPRTEGHALRGRRVEGAGRTAGELPVQITVDRLLDDHLPPQRRRDVGLRMSRCDQPDLEPPVRPDQYL